MKVTKSDPSKTVLTITVGFLVLYLIAKMQWMLTVSIVVGITGILSTYLAKQIDFLWMKLTWILGQIVPNILLSVIFYLFLFPVALLSRLFGKKNLLNLRNSEKSLFKDKNKEFDKASFEKPW